MKLCSVVTIAMSEIRNRIFVWSIYLYRVFVWSIYCIEYLYGVFICIEYLYGVFVWGIYIEYFDEYLSEV